MFRVLLDAPRRKARATLLSAVLESFVRFTAAQRVFLMTLGSDWRGGGALAHSKICSYRFSAQGSCSIGPTVVVVLCTIIT